MHLLNKMLNKGKVNDEELRSDLGERTSTHVTWLDDQPPNPNKAIVILSGGQDSTTCVAQAQKDGFEVHALTFNYGQRHAIEIESAVEVAISMRVKSHEIVDLGPILKGTSPLVSAENQVETYSKPEDMPGGVASTFVPARNILFLTIAANRAAVIGAKVIYIGVCETDFSGYYDCRSSFIQSMEAAIGMGIDGTPTAYEIKTPLMHLTKAESVLLAKELLGDKFEEVMGHTSTCYSGVKGGCGTCAACLLRDRGFQEAGIEDPIWKYREVVK